jgi:hypothetical protein
METILLTAVGTVIAAIAALVVDWLKSDARLKSVSVVYDESSKAVSLLDSWSKVYQQIGSLPDSQAKNVARELAETVLSQALERAKILPRQETASTLVGGVAARLKNLLRLLRVDAPRHPLIWIPQLAYYAAFTMLILVVTRSAANLMDPAVIALFTITVTLWLLCFGLESLARKLSSGKLSHKAQSG